MDSEKKAAFDKLDGIIKAYCASLKDDKDFQALQRIVATQKGIDDEIKIVVDDIIEAVNDTMKNGGDLRAKITAILLRD